MQAINCGPYEVLDILCPVDYVTATPDRRKPKQYEQRDVSLVFPELKTNNVPSSIGNNVNPVLCSVDFDCLYVCQTLLQKLPLIL